MAAIRHPANEIKAVGDGALGKLWPCGWEKKGVGRGSRKAVARAFQWANAIPPPTGAILRGGSKGVLDNGDG